MTHSGRVPPGQLIAVRQPLRRTPHPQRAAERTDPAPERPLRYRPATGRIYLAGPICGSWASAQQRFIPRAQNTDQPRAHRLPASDTADAASWARRQVTLSQVLRLLGRLRGL